VRRAAVPFAIPHEGFLASEVMSPRQARTINAAYGHSEAALPRGSDSPGELGQLYDSEQRFPRCVHAVTFLARTTWPALWASRCRSSWVSAVPPSPGAVALSLQGLHASPCLRPRRGQKSRRGDALWRCAGIWGGKGQGKTFQVELIFKALGVEPVILSAGEMESEWAGEPGQLIRTRYRAKLRLSSTIG